MSNAKLPEVIEIGPLSYDGYMSSAEILEALKAIRQNTA